VSRKIASSEHDVLTGVERDINERLNGHKLDFTAMSAVSNIYRTGTAIRTHMERAVLADYDLSWVAFTVLWILWIWGEQETGHVADEAGVTKGTLTGVMKTLVNRKLIKRIPHRDDRRRVSIALTKSGERLIEKLFPEFNNHETVAVETLTLKEQKLLADLLRKVHGNIVSVDEAPLEA